MFGRGGLLHPTLNLSKWVKVLVETKGKVVINIGSGGFRLAPHIINLDLFPLQDVDIVGDAHHLPFKEESTDYVIIIAVLEHVRFPSVILNEVYYCLKKGGTIYCEMPFLQGFHAAPRDYWRVTKSGIQELLNKFNLIDCGICAGPGSTITWVVSEYVTLLFNNKTLSKIAKTIALILLSPLKYIDLYLIQRQDSEKIASGFYFLGKKA